MFYYIIMNKKQRYIIFFLGKTEESYAGTHIKNPANLAADGEKTEFFSENFRND